VGDNTVDYAWARYGVKAEAADAKRTPAHPVAGTCAFPGCGTEQDDDRHWHGTRHGYADHDLSLACHPFTPVAGTWLEETLARADHEALCRGGGRCPCPMHHRHVADVLVATPAGQSLAARIAALEAAVPLLEAVLRLGHIQDDGPSICMCRTHVEARRWLAVRKPAEALRVRREGGAS
jgi:hypothetical protein